MAKKKIKLSLPERMIKFIETLKVPTGDGVGELFKLMDFQKKMIHEVYGPTNPDGTRVVKEAVLSIARKNGKTSLVAALGVAHLWLPGLSTLNQEGLILGLTREQSGALFKAMSQMILMDNELCHDFSISDSRKTIKHIETNGIVRIESAEAASLHGRVAKFVFCDEPGNWPDGKAREIYQVVSSGFGSYQNHIIWLLSTQSPMDSHIFSEKVDLVKMINRGEIEDPKIKGFIYEIPDGEDCFDEKNWIKANPGLCVIRSIEEMRKKAEEAKRLPSMANSFYQLFCNQRIDSFSPFISKMVWEKNNHRVDISKLAGKDCYAGLDLSAKVDLTSLVLIFPDENDPPKFDVIPFFWKPHDSLRDHSLSQRVPFVMWHEQGWLLTTPGNSISYDFVAKQIYEISQKYNLKGIHYDRWAINNVRMALDAIGCPTPLVECGQGFRDMAGVTNCLEEILLDSRIRSGLNPILTWNIANTVVVSDPAGSRKFDKAKSWGRIDGTVALAMALRLWEIQKHNIKSCYDDPAFVAYMTGG